MENIYNGFLNIATLMTENSVFIMLVSIVLFNGFLNLIWSKVLND